MSQAMPQVALHDIVVDEVFPHAPDVIWKVLTDGDLIARWMMPPKDFAAIEGQRFSFQTTPAGKWDGTIRCRVLEVKPCERFVYSWQGGDEANVGYGSKLDTRVTFTLTKVPLGTRLRVVHSGFELPRNQTAFKSMGDGWPKVIKNLDAMAAEQDKEASHD
ncbi:SRPBCC domain-containing protein [Ferrovibrio sp.]|uniref:SRPBCC family protein n=1 Tax=Ferrovibrio sp. TaxID=1917215 RepID=UPI0025C2BF8A|nr:SRPBCC domain-containing protein [Ferrovibrio sp.]MBX3456312.1 SRPBCC domain-containing protein [Ferrovibrio sp.]